MVRLDPVPDDTEKRAGIVSDRLIGFARQHSPHTLGKVSRVSSSV
jgi:hypothetical protein